MTESPTSATPRKPRKVSPSPILVELEVQGGWVSCAASELNQPFDSTAKAESALREYGQENQVYRIIALKRTGLRLQAKPVATRLMFA
jgi:hypothetical protein